MNTCHAKRVIWFFVFASIGIGSLGACNYRATVSQESSLYTGANVQLEELGGAERQSILVDNEKKYYTSIKSVNIANGNRTVLSISRSTESRTFPLGRTNKHMRGWHMLIISLPALTEETTYNLNQPEMEAFVVSKNRLNNFVQYGEEFSYSGEIRVRDVNEKQALLEFRDVRVWNEQKTPGKQTVAEYDDQFQFDKTSPPQIIR